MFSRSEESSREKGTTCFVPAAESGPQRRSQGTFQFVDKRSESAAIRQLQGIMGSPSDVVQMTAQQSTPTTPALELNMSGSEAGSPEIQNKRGHNQQLKGSIPSVKPTGWNDVLSMAAKVKGQWVRFHLINGEIGGPGNTSGNLVPTPAYINTGTTWKAFEDNVKTYWFANKWVFVKANVTYANNYRAGFPKKITGYGQWYDSSQGTWKTMEKSNTSVDLSNPDFGNGIKTRTFDEMTAATWSLILGRKPGSEQVQYLNHLSSQYKDINVLNEALYDENAPKFSNSDIKNISWAAKEQHDKVNIVVDY